MIYRFEYRGFLREEYNEASLKSVLAETKSNILQQIKDGRLLQVCIYRHESMLFAYIEALETGVNAEELFSALKACLLSWPHEGGSTTWAYMYPIYYQCIPGTVEDWLRERTPGKTKVGRIAWLKHETMFDYVYWHKAITDEGLLKGDKYQFISLHEDMLFSYYEEPRNNINIKGIEGESQAIKGWLDIDPGSHFDLEKSGGPHFKVLQPILIASEV